MGHWVALLERCGYRGVLRQLRKTVDGRPKMHSCIAETRERPILPKLMIRHQSASTATVAIMHVIFC